MYRALVVEDDKDLSTITQMNLTHAGYDVDTAFTCAEALDRFASNSYDLVLLDMVLPDMRGDELCRTIRASCACPIIFVSCLDNSGAIVGALRSGADDYMVKPISYNELLARADAIVRRSNNARGSGTLVFKQFSIDTVHHTVSRGDEHIDLSSIEYAILLFMVQHPGELLLYNQIYEQIWSNSSLGDTRTVMVHISNLRKKIDPDHSGIIETVRGAGYIFSDV